MEHLDFGTRLWLALTLPFRVLFDAGLAARIAHLDHPPHPDALPEPEPKAPPSSSPLEPERDTTAALQLLTVLQREGRLIDFLQEDVSGFSDTDIGAAARVVHEGCNRGLNELVELRAIRSEAEGDPVELAPGYDAQSTRVTGHVTGAPPFKGTLAHPGWRVDSVRLPELSEGHNPTIIAPAEVEL